MYSQLEEKMKEEREPHKLVEWHFRCGDSRALESIHFSAGRLHPSPRAFLDSSVGFEVHDL